MKHSQIKIGVAGGGYWGKNLIRVFYELGALSVICDTNSQLKFDYQVKYPHIKFTTNIEELIHDREIKGIVIATPAHTHYEVAKKSIVAGKNVFVEKPLALKVKEGKELVRLAEEKKKILMVGHILHYHPAIVKLKELIKNGTLGKIYYIYSHRLNIGRIRHEENILWSFAPHDISLVLSLTKHMPQKVRCNGGIYLDHNVEDITLVFFEFPNNLKAHIFVSWLNPIKEQKFVVLGSEKMAVFDDTSENNKLCLYAHKIEWHPVLVPTIHKARAEIVSFEKMEPLKAECEHFLECIESQRIPLTDGYEGLKVLKVLEMAQSSLRRKKK